MNFNNGDKASFFKLLLNDSVDYLSLPPAFAKNYLEKGNNRKQTLVLKPKSAVKWSVKYIKNEDRYYFKDGWLKFIKDNHLQVGDFLSFGISLLLQSQPFRSSFMHLMAVSNTQFVLQVNSVGYCRPPAMIGRQRNSCDDAGAGDGKKRFVSDDDDGGGGGSDDDESLQKVHKSLTKVLRKSFHHQLPISKGFWKANGLNGYDCVRLRTDHEGKIWKVEIRKYGKIKYPFLTSGWYEFWNGNKLEMGYTLQITHVKGNLLHVHVIKGHKGKTIKKKRLN